LGTKTPKVQYFSYFEKKIVEENSPREKIIKK
jgi:hypothetical protein